MHSFPRLFLAVLICVMLMQKGFPQEREYASFTVNDGLPSNNVYQMEEDDKGFLWIETDAGIARFDGKKFQVYTTKQGLPDNDVFYLDKEKDGRIWVSDFKTPAYFDETKNRFVIPLDKKTLDWFNSAGAKATNLFSLPLKNGGMFYCNYKYFLIFKNGKLVKKGERKGKYSGTIIEEFTDGSSLVLKIQIKDEASSAMGLYYYKGEKIADSLILDQGKREFLKGGRLHNGKIYLFNPNYKNDEVVVISDIQANPIRYKQDTIKVPSPVMVFIFSGNSVYFTTHSGKIYVYDQKTLKLKNTFGENYIMNGYGEDSKGNMYISTVDKGILMFRNQWLEHLEIPGNFTHRNFLSIACKEDGHIFAGNYYGEVAEFKNGKFQLHETNKIVSAKIRKILFSGNDIYTFSEQGIYKNYKEKISLQNLKRAKSLSFAKTAKAYNDSVFLIGTHIGLFEYNTKTGKSRIMIPDDYNKVLRITAIEKADESFVYSGSVNGLYKYDFKTEKYVSLQSVDPSLTERISALCYTRDGLLWVSTSSNKLVVLKDDKVILNTFLSNEINSSIRHITAGKTGEVWVSTSNGIANIRYKINGTKISYNTRNLAINDGLLSNDVQELVYSNGKIYAATSNGISIIPEDYAVPKTDIPTYLVQMQVNQKDTVITGHYKLKYGQRNVQMQFSGVDLNGYFSHFQYALDNAEWVNLSGQTLTVQLSTGTHQLKVRAVDSNGNISHKILTLDFDVEAPFWQQIWFWVSFGVLTQIVLYFIISRYLKRKKEAELARKTAELHTATLEQQAFTSLMNPHFIFNALNSIQHYINLQDRKNANRYLSDFASLIRKSFDAAQQSFIPLEEEMENIKIYLNLEQMRFNERFSYSLHIAEDLDPEEWMVPTMIIQPILENALLHGIMLSAKKGEISVYFQLWDEDLLIEITDNGIGVENSLALKETGMRKSHGVELIKKRIKALGKFGTKPISITMGPAFSDPVNPGNRVVIFLPADLYSSWLKNN